MRILYVIPYFPPADCFGGPPRNAYLTAKQLVDLGHEVTVYTSNASSWTTTFEEEPSSLLDGIEVRYFRVQPGRSIARLLITPDLIFQAKREIETFDIAHLHEYRSFQNAVVFHYLGRSNVPYVIQPHGSLPRMVSYETSKRIFDLAVGYRMLRNAERVLVLSDLERRDSIRFGVNSSRTVYQPNGLDFSEFDNLPAHGLFKRKFNIPSDWRMILYIGRLHFIKGLDILLKAFSIALHYDDSLCLAIVGPDGGFMKQLIKGAANLGVTSRVLFTGALHGAAKLEAFVDSDFVVLPSRYEAFPYVLLEANACKKPVVATSVGDVPNIIRDGVNGLVVAPGDVAALANAITALVESEEARRRMGMRGYSMTKRRFSLNLTTRNLELLYEEIRYA